MGVTCNNIQKVRNDIKNNDKIKNNKEKSEIIPKNNTQKEPKINNVGKQNKNNEEKKNINISKSDNPHVISGKNKDKDNDKINKNTFNKNNHYKNNNKNDKYNRNNNKNDNIKNYENMGEDGDNKKNENYKNNKISNNYEYNKENKISNNYGNNKEHKISNNYENNENYNNNYVNNNENKNNNNYENNNENYSKSTNQLNNENNKKSYLNFDDEDKYFLICPDCQSRYPTFQDINYDKEQNDFIISYQCECFNNNGSNETRKSYMINFLNDKKPTVESMNFISKEIIEKIKNLFEQNKEVFKGAKILENIIQNEFIFDESVAPLPQSIFKSNISITNKFKQSRINNEGPNFKESYCKNSNIMGLLNKKSELEISKNLNTKGEEEFINGNKNQINKSRELKVINEENEENNKL